MASTVPGRTCGQPPTSAAGLAMLAPQLPRLDSPIGLDWNAVAALRSGPVTPLG
jgi:hypothetical protein